MAHYVYVDGAALIKVGSGAAGALEELGYTANGVELTFESFMEEVPGDQNGGDAGPPIELNYLGEIARIRMELTKWDATIADKIAARIRGATAGTPAAAGTLLFANTYEFRTLIVPSYRVFNFPRTVPKEAFQINKGTRYSRFVFEMTAYKNDSGVLFNSTST